LSLHRGPPDVLADISIVVRVFMDRYSLGRQQAGLSTRADFAAWMERNRLSLSQAARAIGMTRRMIAYYKSGARPIPKTVWLGCIGYEALKHKAA